MKLLVLFLVLVFSLDPLAHATPAPARSKSVEAKKASAGSSAKSVQKKNVKSKKKTTKAVTQKYKVRSGDSLYTIARRYKMKVDELQRLNGLQSSRLKIGQMLVVSSKAKKQSGSDRIDEVVEESGQVISQIALPNADGLFAESFSEAGIEPIARSYLSIPYRYGAQSRKSTDCSGFVQQVFREFDIKLPRTAREQYRVGSKIERANLSSGDLLFFRTRARKKYPTHVGIYLGNGKMIHASSRQRKVVISDVNHPYYVKRYVGAKRTANFLPGEIDLEMLARQVTGIDADTPLVSAIVTDVHEEEEAAMETALLSEGGAPGLIMEAGYDDRGEEVSEEGDDIDNEVEPEPESIVADPPHLGMTTVPSGEDQGMVGGAVVAADSTGVSEPLSKVVDHAAYGTTTVTAAFPAVR